MGGSGDDAFSDGRAVEWLRRAAAVAWACLDAA